MSDRVGYDVTITRRDFQMASTDWHVRVKRLSDGAEMVRTFGWRWRARRFGRSTRRLGREFERYDKHRLGEVECFTIGWRDA